MKKTKIWIGVGAFVVGTSSIGAEHAAAETPSAQTLRPALASTSAAAITIAQHRSGEGGESEGGERSSGRRGSGEEGGERRGSGEEGGERSTKAHGSGAEGGEGGEGGSKGLPPDLEFALKIALMRGHLLAGHHLLLEKRWENAYEHFLHPAAELYGSVRGRLKQYGVRPFEATLKVLANVVRQKKSGPEYAAARADVLKVLDEAEAAARKTQGETVPFQVDAAMEVLKVAADEYDAALDGRRVVNQVEYQDARAFALVAKEMIEGISSELERKDSEALATIRASLGRINDALSAPVPPRNASLDYGAFLGEVSRIELAASRLAQ